jgi:methyl-accepting chemotaxis protein
MSQELVSFVIRFVREVSEDQQARWRGIIKHVQGDTETHFTQFSEALAFMQEHVNELIQATFEDSERLNEEAATVNPFLETTRLWGEYMPRYTQLITDMMEQMAAGAAGAGAAGSGSAAANPMTEQMKQTMAASFKAWGIPTQTEQEKTAATLETMTEQMVNLVNKMDELDARVRALKKK